MRYYLIIDNNPKKYYVEGFFLQSGSKMPVPAGKYFTVHFPFNNFSLDSFLEFQEMVNNKSHSVKLIGIIDDLEDKAYVSENKIFYNEEEEYEYIILVEAQSAEIFNLQLSNYSPYEAPTLRRTIYELQFLIHKLKNEEEE